MPFFDKPSEGAFTRVVALRVPDAEGVWLNWNPKGSQPIPVNRDQTHYPPCILLPRPLPISIFSGVRP